MFVRGNPVVGTYGTLTLAADGLYNYEAFEAAADTLAVGQTATDSFTYQVSDGQGGFDTATLTITVNGVNDRPVAGNDTGAVLEDATLTVSAAGVLANDTDVDTGATRTVSQVQNSAGNVGVAVAGTFGTLTLAANGSYSYEANLAAADALAAGQTAVDSFNYQVTDDQGGTDTALLEITVTGVNDAPDAVNDSGSVLEGDTVSKLAAAGVLANDTDVDAGATRIVSQVQGLAGNVGTAILGTYGTLTLNVDGSYSYSADQPAAEALAEGQPATDSFTYQVSDGLGGFDTATLEITVTGSNDEPPNAVDDTGAVLEDGTLNVSAALGVLANDTDIDTNDILTVSQVEGLTGNVGTAVVGTYGTLTLNVDGSYTYVADQAAADALADGQTAIDDFTYRLSDGNFGFDIATLAITVTGVNDAPEFLGAPPANLLVNGSFETPVATGTYLSFFAPGDAAAISGWTIAQAGVQLIGEPYWEASDGANSVQLKVAGFNHFGALDQSFATVAGQQYLVEFDLTANGSDGQTHTMRVSADGQSQTFSAVGTNNPNAMGYTARSFTFTANDASATLRLENIDTYLYGSIIDNVRVTAVGAYGPAVGSVTEAADGSPGETGNVTHQASGTVAFSDLDLADAHTVSVVPGGGGYFGTLAANVANDSTGDGSGLIAWSFSASDSALDGLAAGQTVTQTYQLVLDDGEGGTDTETVTITLTGANDAPDAVNDTGAVNEGDTLTVNAAAGVLTNDTDVDTGATRTVSQVQGLGANVGAAVAGTLGTLTLAANGSYTYVANLAAADALAAGATAVDSFTYQVSDGLGGTDTATLAITVTGVNDAPDAVNDTGAVSEGGTVSKLAAAGVLTNDTDVDAGATKAVSQVQGLAGNVGSAVVGTYGTLTLNIDGSYSYSADQPAANALADGQVVTDSFAYEVSDGLGGFDTATLAITVTGANDTPDAVNDTGAVNEDATLTVNAAAGVLANDTDVDTLDVKTVSQVQGTGGNVGSAVAGTYGTLTMAANGSYTYVADLAAADALAAGVTANDSFTYQVSDGEGGFDTATLQITVTGVNDTPDAVNDVNEVLEDDSTLPANVLSNDTDVDVGDVRTVSQVQGVAGNVGHAVVGTYGTLTLAADGSYNYVADQAAADALAVNEEADDVFTYQVSDGKGGFDTATLTITVVGDGSAPPTGTVNIEVNGAAELNRLVDNRYRLGDANTGPILKIGGVEVLANSIPGWNPISVEPRPGGGGFDVAWENTTTGQFTIWRTDNNGNYLTSPIGIVLGTSYALQDLEDDFFFQNLNGDSTTGLTRTVIETNETVDLVQLADRFFFETAGPGSGIEFRYLGAPVTDGQFGDFDPTSAKAAAGGGFDVVFKNATTDQYVVWHTDSAGNYASSVTGVVSGSNSTLQGLETSFAQDINGDGTIGLASTVIETAGSTDLTQVGDHLFFGPGGTTPSFKYLGAEVTVGQFPGWSVIAAEAEGDGYHVAFKATASDQYVVWHTDNAGNYTSNVTGIVSGDTYALQDLETIFQQDLNSDGTTGLFRTIIETNEAVDLVAVADRFYFETAGPPGVSFKYLGADVVENLFAGWAPIAVKASSGGTFDVAWKNAGTDQYTVWHTDSTGNYTSTVLGIVSSTDLTLQALEAGFAQDLNGNGFIG